jgi:Kef-type K+ transport system membrane component KefB
MRRKRGKMLGWGILGLIAWIIIAIWPARVAAGKGHSFVSWFVVSIFFWWITLFFVYFGMNDKTKTARDIANDKAVEKQLAREERRA